MRLAPGDPAVLRFGAAAALPENQPRIEALRHEMGLDQPIIVQYGIWLRDALHGNFGTSLQSNFPAAELRCQQGTRHARIAGGCNGIAR